MMSDDAECPERLWHYTSGSGAKAIFKSRTLWAGHLGYMNDTSEVNQAVEVSHDVATRLRTELPEHEDAAARFRAGVVAVQDRCCDRPIVIGTHGMVLTNWLVSIGAVSAADATGFWSDLRSPDCIEVDTVNGSWRRYA